MTAFKLSNLTKLNKGLIISQDDTGVPIDSLLGHLFKELNMNNIQDTSTLDLVDVLKWNIRHSGSTSTNAAIIECVIKKILQDKESQYENINSILLKLHNDHPLEMFEMWEDKLNKSFHPGYWLIAAQLMPTEIIRLSSWLKPFEQIKTIAEAHKTYNKLEILSNWHPSKACWKLLEDNIPKAAFNN